MSAPVARSLDGEQLADLIMRLLLDGRLRERLATDGAAAVAAGAGELECLETIDLDELDAAARRFRSTIWRLGAGGSLASAFPRSVSVFAAAGVGDAELLDGFLGSPRFSRFRLIPYSGPGVSVEEAFAAFLLDLAEARLSDAVILRETVGHELMIALFAALSCEQPLSFVIESEGIVETGRGHAALRRYAPASLASWGEATGDGDQAGDVPYAYFATPAGVSRGVVSERVAAAFAATPTAESDAARRALSRRGLW
ncbi:hypothetical protein [Nonomuraea aurantiaca]|uniref:hypothetical protein n=1 Tax=Nonomuraea aurantiaca TaxID=2878562 RepID=UPI001CD935BC|nr:hypothetical protein [Nonomuraea aurantiaca]MCA2228884.1 hypothetical protein [Nonomuraea aurantiaca]